jgi:hypothetical protein
MDILQEKIRTYDAKTLHHMKDWTGEDLQKRDETVQLSTSLIFETFFP